VTFVVAHRGASAYEVENSLSAFRLAHAMGAEGIELDVHVTADGVPIVHHDPVVAGHPIWHTPWTALGDHTLSNGESIPTLAEALETIDPSLQVFVEVKSLEPRNDVNLLSVLDRGPAPSQYQIHAFDHRIVRRLRAHRPSLVAGVLSASYPVRPLISAQEAGAAVLWQQETLVDEDLIDLAHAEQIQVFAWTVDDRARMQVLSSLGIDALCTNRPDVAREVLG
jgi:glycerophosphoryl diester phosphodiesterase